jgi:hypothetical protein
MADTKTLATVAAVGAGFTGAGIYNLYQGYQGRPDFKAIHKALKADVPMSDEEIKRLAKAMHIEKPLFLARTADSFKKNMHDGLGYNRLESWLLTQFVKGDLKNGTNAYYIPGNKAEKHMLALGNHVSPVVVMHELGHAKDYETGGIQATAKKNELGIFDQAKLLFSSQPFKEKVIAREIAAWNNVPEHEKYKDIQNEAIKSYTSMDNTSRGLGQAIVGSVFLEEAYRNFRNIR